MLDRTDTDRLKWLAGIGSADGPVIEGFVGVECCFYQYAGMAAEYRGSEEVEEEDLLTGLRELIDAAMASESIRFPSQEYLWGE